MKTDYFKIPHNKHLGKKPKDWQIPKYSEIPKYSKGKQYESIIKWQTGEPKTHGRYLVQTKEDGFQIAFWPAYVKTWSLYHNSEIIAWCNLSDIEPYKEKQP